LKRGRQVM